MAGKSNFLPAFCFGATMATISNFFNTYTPSEVLGYSLSMYGVAMAVNAWDIYTGVRLDWKKQKAGGAKRFSFNDDKGFKAIQKILGFMIVLYMIHSFEQESIRLHYNKIVPTILNASKSIFFVYVILIELKSIGNNNKEYYGEKSALFVMLDNIIDLINKGIIDYIKRTLKIKSNEEN